MKFVLSINLGNDAMQTSGDVAEALWRVYRNLNSLTAARVGSGDAKLRDTDEGKIVDVNGNTVGAWEVKGPYDDNDE
jgi:hypothetical protein